MLTSRFHFLKATLNPNFRIKILISESLFDNGLRNKQSTINEKKNRNITTPIKIKRGVRVFNIVTQ